MPRLLYLLTGVATAIPVVFALGWAVWGAGVSITEYISLLGSLVLAVSATGILNKRGAARLAVVGCAGIWSFYLPVIMELAKERVTDQELSLTILLWARSPSPL